MASVPRNRRAPTSPRQKLVLKLNQIRCVECDGSANCAYLRPFRTYWTPDGWVTHCRLCGTPHKRHYAEPGVMRTASASAA